MKYRDMTPEQKEARKAHMKQYNDEHREELKKYREEHREERKAHNKQWREEHREERKRYFSEHKAERNARIKKYIAEDLNRDGMKKCTIRCQSRYILYKNHAKLDGYEIHHCFGYEDPSKFIYIPKKLHLKIHQLLRDKKISADSDHWDAIRDLVNSCEEYTYIKC